MRTTRHHRRSGADGELIDSWSAGDYGKRRRREEASGSGGKAAACESDSAVESVDGSNAESRRARATRIDGRGTGGGAETKGRSSARDGSVADGAEKAVSFVGQASSEVDIGVKATADGGAIADGRTAGEELPKGRVVERLAGGVNELAKKAIGLGVVDVDGSVAEVADEEVAGEDAEAGGGSEGDAPRRVEIASGDGTRDEVATGVEYIDDAITRTSGGNVRSGGAAKCVGDPYLIVEDVHGPRCVTGGQIGIGEGTGELSRFEGLVVDLDRVSGTKVGSDDVAGRRVDVKDGEARIGGSGGGVVDGDECGWRVLAERTVPAGDGAVERGEEERRFGAVGEQHAAGSAGG